MPLRLASYNIHRCYGRDGNHDPARIREVLRQTRADVIALQEVELLRDEPELLDYFCKDSPWTAFHGPTLEHSRANYGNALLSSLSPESVNRIDLSQPGREPRGAIEALLRPGKNALRVLVTHLGLLPGERRAQISQLLEIVRNKSGYRAAKDTTLLMGDLNEWFLWGRPLRRLKTYFPQSPAPPTFPARFPVFALDRIWAQPAGQLRRVRVLDNALTRVASDHLPLLAELESPDAWSGFAEHAS